MSALKELEVKYKSREVDRTSAGTITKLAYQGSKALCDQAMNEDFFIGRVYEDGVLESMRLTQDEGPFWALELLFNKSEEGNQTNAGPSRSTLTVRMLGLPLERHKNYRLRWDHNLYTTYGKTTIPTQAKEQIEEIWKKATYDDDKIPHGNRYMGTPKQKKEVLSEKLYLCWGKYLSDCPALPNGQTWTKIGTMVKPGVEFFNYPTYELTEYSQARTASQAAWMLKKAAGKITKPLNGDFGVVKKFGGNWLCEGGGTQWDGKYYQTTITYVHSPDALAGSNLRPIKGTELSGVGWDEAIYDLAGVDPDYDILHPTPGSDDIGLHFTGPLLPTI